MKEPTPIKKSDRTKETILNAAKAVFAEKDYERATMREIAARANVDPALVMRYFGSKDELFALAADFNLMLPNLGEIDPSKLGEVLADHYLTMWEGGAAGLPILLRSATSNERAAAHMREIFRAQVLPAIAQVVGNAEAPARAGLVASQLLGMALCRYILKLPPVVAMPRRKLVEEIGATLQRYITG